MPEETKKNVVMLAKDTVAAPLAECYITIGDRRYNFMQALNVEVTFTKTKSKIPILGQTGKGNKATGWEGTGKATFHYNTSVFREMMYNYKESGLDTYFDMTIVNEDKGCNIDGGVLAKFDADGEYLDEDMDFTFEDFSIPKKFAELTGFLMSE